jgi:arylsulfatase A-like enzyme
MRLCTRVVLILKMLLLGSVLAAPATAKNPNVLIFLCDDVGWGEFGFQGNKEIPTPNIDSIANNGVRFSQGYVAATYCSPTRAGLLTGRYPTRFGHEFNSVARLSGLSLKETTMAERFHSLGYATCAIGKWHLGSAPEYRPMSRGFDEFFGTLANTPFFHPTQFVDSRISPDVQKIEDPDFYTTDQYADRAVDWLGKQSKDRPWLLYVPFNAQHAPLQAPKKYLERFKNISDEKRRAFAAMMYSMDRAVGDILDKIRALGEEDDTLIFFLSDNGGPTRSTTSKNGPLRGFKMTTWEGGTRVPFCVQWKGKLPAGKTYDHPVVQLDILPTALAAAGVDAKPEWKLDGVNLLPYLTGEKTEQPHETLYWRYGDQWAVRHGNWKLVAGNGGDLKDGELYNLANDVSESKNRAPDMPDKVNELKSLWDKWNAEQVPPSFPQEKPAATKPGNRPNKDKQKNKRRNAKAQAAKS